jgi:hypothetical protein
MPGFLDTGPVHPFLDHRGPIAIAHRGGAGEAPESTLAAFEIAVALGIGAIPAPEGAIPASGPDRAIRPP